MADLATTNAEVIFNVGSKDKIGIQLTGTFSAVATFSVSVDNVNYVTAAVLPVGTTNAISVTTASTTGAFVGSIKGMRSVKVALTSYTSGTTTVSASVVQ